MSRVGPPGQFAVGPVSLHPIEGVYLAILLLTVVGFIGATAWVVRGASTARIRGIVPLNVVATVWAGVSAVELAVADPTYSLPLVYLRTVLSYLTVVGFVYFGTVYSGRSTSLRRPFNAIFLSGMVVGLVGLLTHPWHGLHFDPLVYTTEPFPYYRTGIGPLWLAGYVWSYVGIAASLYYLGELVITSRHRSSRPLVVFSVGVVLGLVPSGLTLTGRVPTLPGYDHTVLGLGMVGLALFVGAWLGMAKIAPITRDRLLEMSGDALVVRDDDGQVVDHNAEAERVLTASLENPIGSPLVTVAPALASALDGRDDPEAGESHTVEFDQDGRWYSVLVSPVTDGETVAGSVLLVRDVTERHQTRAELRRQNSQLDEFASGVAHHLRNPLQVASGQTEIARARLREADGAPSPDSLDRLAELERALDRMETIITDLRTMAEQGKSVESTSAVAFGDAARLALSHVDTGRATLTVATDGTIRADKGRLLSMLENLVRNSVEHGQSDGRVGITVRLTPDGFVLEDDGPGIDADESRLFEYGYTTSSEGSGLGLSIVQTMAESHGWSVRVDPDHDGARFVVSGAVTTVGG